MRTETSQRILLATFADEADLIAAVRAVRRRGAKIVDVYSPYAVHGLDEALGWRPSRLTWVCGLCGAAGAAFMLWLQFWTSAVDWPLNIGGKPFNSLPAFVPVIFEAMVLCGALGTVLAFFIVSRLRPGKRVSPIVPRVSDDRFALLVEQTDAAFDTAAMTVLLQQHQAAVEERAIGGRPVSGSDHGDGPSGTRLLNPALAVVLAAIVLAVIFTPRNTSQPHLEFMPTMRRSVALQAQTPFAALPALAARPIPGTLARGNSPLDYQATDEDSLRAGRELGNPFAADDAVAVERGRFVFQNFCASCHGPGGEGDGPVAIRGFPPPPPLSAEKSRLRPDGELFHVISYGVRNMPGHRKQLSQEDRWRVTLFIRQLQGSSANSVGDSLPDSQSARGANDPP